MKESHLAVDNDNVGSVNDLVNWENPVSYISVEPLLSGQLFSRHPS